MNSPPDTRPTSRATFPALRIDTVTSILLGRGKEVETTCKTLALRSALFKLSTNIICSDGSSIHASVGVKSRVTLWTPKTKSVVVETVVVVVLVVVVTVTVVAVEEVVVVVVVEGQLNRSAKSVKLSPVVLSSAPPPVGSARSALSTHNLKKETRVQRCEAHRAHPKFLQAQG